MKRFAAPQVSNLAKVAVLASIVMLGCPAPLLACDKAPVTEYSTPSAGKWRINVKGLACAVPAPNYTCHVSIPYPGLTAKQFTIDGVTTKLVAPYPVSPFFSDTVGITTEMMYHARSVTIQGTGNLPPGVVENSHAGLMKMPANAEHLVDLKQPAPRIELVTKP